MIKQWQTNVDYHCFINNTKAKLDSSERIKLRSAQMAAIATKLSLFDVDAAMSTLLPFYSKTGRPAKSQAQIMRSVLLWCMLMSKHLAPTSLTQWVANLKEDRLLCMLIGCSPEQAPCLSAYYTMMDRLWSDPHRRELLRRDTLLPADWSFHTKPKKPSGKGQKLPETRANISEQLADRILHDKPIPWNYEERLQDLFYKTAVLPSIACGIIPNEHLTTSGDGTCVHTHARATGHTVTGSERRHFADPEATTGWDSDLNEWYYGYTLFQISCHNADLKVDVPILLRYTSARRHDAVNFLVSFNELRIHMPAIRPENMCLDSAMDNMPTYELLKAYGIRAFIDLNKGRGHPKQIKDSVSLSSTGIPICSAGIPMSPNGFDKKRGVKMWRCPYCTDLDKRCTCNCTDAKYGRVFKTHPENDIRLYPDVPRGSKEYKAIYNDRSADERINDRILNDYCLHAMRIHTREHYSFMTTFIGICIHLDARYKGMAPVDTAA